jgi:hypothetical protein
MLVELHARNYATLDGLVNGVDGIFLRLYKNVFKIIHIDIFWKPNNWKQHKINIFSFK